MTGINEQLAGLWREVKRPHQMKIETLLLKRNEGFVVKYLTKRHPRKDYRDILFSALQQSIIPALARYDVDKGLNFITYWVWWMKAYYNRTELEEVGVFPLKGNPHRYKTEGDDIEAIKAYKAEVMGTEYTPDASRLPRTGARAYSKPVSVPMDTPVHEDLTLGNSIGVTPDPYEHDPRETIDRLFKGRTRQVFLLLLDGCSRQEIHAITRLSLERVRQIIFKERTMLRRLVLEG